LGFVAFRGQLINVFPFHICSELSSYSREVATKVLGAKMLQGYTLKETTCDRCAMPLMEKRNKVECVVCPALEKKAKKKMKAEKKLTQERARLEFEIARRKELEAEQKMKHDKEDRLARSQLEKIERERVKLEERLAAEAEAEHLKKEQRKLELEAEEARLLALEQEEEARIAALEEEEARLLREARERAQEHARQQELDRLETLSKQKAEEERLAEIQRMTEEKLSSERSRQKEEELALLEETRRLEEIETKSLATKTEEMHKDLLKHEHRRRMAKKIMLDSEVAKLENDRHKEQLELRRVAEEKKAEEESRILAALEADAAAKALAAEDAIRKAKAALETVNSTRRELIAETIALAEREAIAECEETIKAEREDYKEKVILPTESELHLERWETLRVEGRAIMTRRVLKGWELIPEACQGAECHMTPLLMKNGKKECVVCGGCGNGVDGVYSAENDDEEVDIHHAEATRVPYEIEAEMPDDPSIDGSDDDFEEKRDLVSKEIGKRMLLGWTLLDASCPKCVMPLMMDNNGSMNICVLHGAVEPYDDSKPTEVEDEHDEDEICEKRAAVIEEPTVEETEVQTEPEFQHEPEVKSEDLLKTIRERANQQNSVDSFVNSKSDPPAFTKATKNKLYEKQEPPVEEARALQEMKSEEENIKGSDTNDAMMPKSFDFGDPASVQELLGSAAEYEEDQENNSMTPEMVANMFLKSPQGYDFHDDDFNMPFQDVKDLVDIFTAANFENTMSEGFRGNVAEIIMKQLKNDVLTPTIHLEDMASPESDKGRSYPRNFHFNDFEDDNHSVNTATKRGKPNPETVTTATQPSNPRPKHISANPAKSFDLPPRSPQARSKSSRSSGGGGAPVVVGGPLAGKSSAPRHHFTSDTGSIGGASRASTVASDALESIYVRIDECKAKLMDPTNSITEQLATADLLEKLAKAAVAVRAMEKLEEE
jgi:uncharacterized Zn finger protein (UPF0148 family)